MEHKTNALRMLDQKKIPHEVIDCGITEAVSGTEMAGIIGENPDCVFKTLVTVGKSGEHYVFMVPVEGELSSGSRGRKICRYDKVQRAFAHNRIRARRVLSDRNEEIVPHDNRLLRKKF